jgi:hypothetical protein
VPQARLDKVQKQIARPGAQLKGILSKRFDKDSIIGHGD